MSALYAASCFNSKKFNGDHFSRIFNLDHPVGPSGLMPLARFESLEKSLKARILDVSKQEFATHGYEGASYNKIIQKIGISKGSMYYYFENKEDLFITCIINEARSTGMTIFEPSGISKVDDHETYWNSIQDMFSKQWKDSLQHPHLMALIHQVASLGSEHHIVRKLNSECEGLLEYNDLMAILNHGARIGAIRSDVPHDVLIRMSTEYKIWLIQEMHDQRLDENQVITQFFEMFKQLFEARR
jgi:AcrR family transcriptional regulator